MSLPADCFAGKQKPRATSAKPAPTPTCKLNFSFFLHSTPPHTSLPRRSRSDAGLRSDIPPTSVKGFFADCPWGRVPEHRKVDILIEPVYSTRGLLGGASKEGKMSKLAALAARKRKENANPAMPSKTVDEPAQDEYAASLSKLSLSSEKSRDRMPKSNAKDGGGSMTEEPSTRAEGASELDRVDSMPAVKDEPIVERNGPSAFAGTFLDKATSDSNATIDTSIIGTQSSMFDFKDPSPDDIVYKAQTGRTR